MVDFRTQCSYFGSSNNPSFSSSLLDAIYRSIDLAEDEDAAAVCREEDTMRKKELGHGANVRAAAGVFRSEEEMTNFRRACMIEKWMEKKVGEKVSVRRKSGDDLKMKKFRKDRENSSSSSSDSSRSGGFFSSSEAESFPAAIQRPKPVRTGGAPVEKVGGNFEINCRRYGGDPPEQKAKRDGGGFLKTKSRALKLYGDLKKVKQPISPGGKLAGFLNALFAGGNPRKHKPADSLKSANASTCSSASSFSRSCLSKTPSSRGKPSAGNAKRSVRFSPVSVIVDDEDSRSCEHKSFHQSSKNQASNSDLPIDNSIRSVIKEELMAKNWRVEAAARDQLRNYHRKNQTAACSQFEYQMEQLRKPQVKKEVFDRDFEEEEEDDDDAASCASSDLFELDNLSAIGMEELPVYETTNLGRNRAIAKGFIL